MRTLIQGGWVVGFDGRGHELIPNGCVVETVIVDSEVLIENGRATRVDEQALLAAVQAEGERLWHAVPEWRWSGKALGEIMPPSYPVRG